MSSHKPKVDPIAKIVFLISILFIVTAVYVLVSSLISTYKRNSTKGKIDTTQLIKNVEENLEPIGVSSLSGAPVAAAAGRSGKEVFETVCTACHTAGVLGAPKFGDKAAWEPRAARGLDALMISATKGKGSMPARGGNPSLTDSEIRATILYMTKKAGIELAGAAEEKKEAPVAKAPKAETKTKTEMKAKEEPAVAVAPTTSTKTPKAQSASAVEPPKAEAKTEIKVEEEPAVVVAPTPTKAPEPEPAPAVPVAPTVPAAPVVAEVPVAAATPAAPSIDGKKIYGSVCFACHATGVAGSPKFGDKTAWAPRIATGKDALYHSALNGKGAMPPKGGNLSLSDDKVKAAVDYMVSQAK